jgi:hypothetical protein
MILQNSPHEKTTMQNFMTRAQAFAAGLSKYDTGKPCRNGHRAMRYTQSGTCEACIRASQLRAQAEHNAGAPEREARKQYALNIVAQPERVPSAMLDSLVTIADAMLACRFPTLAGLVDFRCNPKPCKAIGGTVQATFLVHLADRAAFHSICDNALHELGVRAIAMKAAARDEAMQQALPQ